MWRVYPTCSTADLPVTVRCWVSRPPFSVLKTKEAKKGEGLGFTLNSCNPSCGPPAVADRTLQIMRIFHQQNGAKKRIVSNKDSNLVSPIWVIQKKWIQWISINNNVESTNKNRDLTIRFKGNSYIRMKYSPLCGTKLSELAASKTRFPQSRRSCQVGFGF
jgi:hypothetical protein